MTQENQYSAQKSKPPYLLGLLCLIPLVGALVGVGLLLFGIFKYKDKLLIAIGAFGVFFTVCVYSFLYHYMKNGESPKKGFAEISQIQLNSLVKNIEFYKLQHENYPDSLQQLLIDDKLAPIHDAIQSVQQRQNSYYNYEKIEHKYLLFSSGQDGIPKTEDDLFPKISISDSNKIGWIKSK